MFQQIGFIFRQKPTYFSTTERRHYLVTGTLLLELMIGKLGSICPPSAPPKPRPASFVNQTLVQGLGETEMDGQTEKKSHGNVMKSVVEKVWMSIDRKGQSLAKKNKTKNKSMLRTIQADKTKKKQKGNSDL